jgi:signal transduction histidine kinase
MAIDNARLYRDAQEGIRLREEFLSVASHELRTPVAGIMLSIESLASSGGAGGSIDPSSSRKLLDLLVRHGRRLARLIGDLLDVSRLQKPLSLEREEVDLVRLVREVLARLEPDAVRARCSVSIQAGGPVTGSWDRSRLDQVITNLLSNAVKFGAGKPIEISVGTTADGLARLAIRDHGIGISPEFQPRLFGRFERGVSADHYGGLGLGLYISRRIVEAHGGLVRVESQPGAGATFTVDLPCTPRGAGP